jgi:hypothetical protein
MRKKRCSTVSGAYACWTLTGQFAALAGPLSFSDTATFLLTTQKKPKESVLLWGNQS